MSRHAHLMSEHTPQELNSLTVLNMTKALFFTFYHCGISFSLSHSLVSVDWSPLLHQSFHSHLNPTSSKCFSLFHLWFLYLFIIFQNLGFNLDWVGLIHLCIFYVLIELELIGHAFNHMYLE
jgi:hypothetical protein